MRLAPPTGIADSDAAVSDMVAAVILSLQGRCCPCSCPVPVHARPRCQVPGRQRVAGPLSCEAIADPS
jgi:hypothetical protein